MRSLRIKHAVMLILYKQIHLDNLKLCSAQSISGTIKLWKTKFENNSVPDAQGSIENIVAHVLGFKRVSDVLLYSDENLTVEQNNLLNSLCECRLSRMPLQYVIKEWDFRDLELIMRPPVFIPRPETEMLIDIVIENVPKFKSFIEVGCGSGAISLALLKALPEVTCTAVDQSLLACKLTLDNARKVGVSERIEIFQNKLDDEGNFNETLPFDNIEIIVSNPPYVLTKQIADLQPEIKLYEDLRALDGGKDGMRVIKALLILADRILTPNGALFLEVDPSHPDLIRNWLNNNRHLNLSYVKTFKDFCDRDRFVFIKKK